MKDYFVKASEEECGTDLYIVRSDKSEEEVMEILEMASRYSRVVYGDFATIEEGIEEYDEYYEEIINNDECGLYKFEQYVKLRGLQISPLCFDFEFEW